MNIELNEREYEVRSRVTNQPWTIFFDVVAEVSGDREEPALESIDYSNVKFIPSNALNREDYETFMCGFMSFDTLYFMFSNEDLDKVKADVEEDCIDDCFNGGHEDYLYEHSSDDKIGL